MTTDPNHPHNPGQGYPPPQGVPPAQGQGVPVPAAQPPVGQPPVAQPPVAQAPVAQAPVAQPPAGQSAAKPEVKTKFPMIAMILTAVATVIILIGYVWAGMMIPDIDTQSIESLNKAIAAAQGALDVIIGVLGFASLINFAAFILSIIAIVKDRPKKMAIISLVLVIILPALAVFIGQMIQGAMFPSL